MKDKTAAASKQQLTKTLLQAWHHRLNQLAQKVISLKSDI
jgi:hypothetical protein